MPAFETLSSSPERQKREKTLQEMLIAIQKLVTVYEYEDGSKETVGIDPELRETIAIFLAIGLYTDQSCWGHPEQKHQKRYINLVPYISFSGFPFRLSDYDLKNNPEIEAADEEEDDEKSGYTMEEVDAAAEHVRIQYPILQHLVNAFYKHHSIHHPLLELKPLSPGSPTYCLETKGRHELDDLELAQQEIIIREARQQWTLFTQFVKDRYLHDPSLALNPVIIFS